MKRILAIAVIAAASAVAAAEDKPFVAFVNVGNAVKADLFASCATNFVPGVMPARIRPCAADKVDVVSIMNLATPDQRFGKNVALCVYFVSDAVYPPQLTAPGHWAIINVRNLEKDADAEKFKTRIQKMMLKGLAFACGFGANQDIGRCVMGAGSFETLRGIDGTSASYSPFVAFPLMDFLSARNLIEEPTFE